MKTFYKIMTMTLMIVILSNQSYSQNKSLYLKDTSSYGKIPFSSSFSTIALNNKLTFECWINPLQVNGPIIYKEGCWTIEHSQSGIILRLNSSAPFIVPVNLANYSWQHLAVVFDGNSNELKVYVNGILRGTRSVSQEIQDLTTDVYLGRKFLGGNPTNNIALFDDVRIWNLIRTQQEIYNSFQSGLNGNEIGLIANYKLDNAFLNNFTDASPNQNHGTLTGPYEITSDTFTPGIYTSTVWNEKMRISNLTSLKHTVVSCPDNNTVWVWDGYRNVIKTLDGGETWNSFTVPDTVAGNAYRYWSMAASNGSNCLITASNSNSTKVWKTSNGGVTWQEVFYQAPGFINSIKMINENTGYMMGDPNGGRWSLWKTNDGGTTWDSSGLNLPQYSGEYSLAGNMTCEQGNGWYFYTTRNGFYKSTDFVHFNYQSSSDSIIAGNDLLFIDDSNGLVYTYPNGIVKSNDGGSNWFNSSGFPVYPLQNGGTYTYGMFAKVNNDVYTVRGGNILKSNDAGSSFNYDYCPGIGNISIVIKSAKIENNITSVYALSDYGYVYKANIQSVGVQNISTTLAENYSLSQNYPNPFNPSTKIKFDIVRSGTVKLKVYDMLGKEVAVLVNENLSAGSYETDFDGSGLTSGIYFYRIEADSYTEVKKMTLLK